MNAKTVAAWTAWHRETPGGSWQQTCSGPTPSEASRLQNLILGLTRPAPTWRFALTTGGYPRG